MPRIVAPVCSMDEIDSAIDAGADEIYFGIMPKKWMEQYGNADFITRRQSELTHFTTYDDLSEIIYRTNEHHCSATLVLNARYSEKQLPHIFEILVQWEERGGQAVMVSDIELMLWLNDKRSKLQKHLSVMAGIFNSQSVGFFEQFEITRIVLPREMAVSEIAQLIQNTNKKIEFETIVMFQKCPFIDSFCNFYHAYNYQPYMVAGYTGERKGLTVLESYDPCYEGHGCQMAFICDGTKVRHVDHNDMTTPYCAACSFDKLLKAGVQYFKIAGRGYPVELINRSIRFVRSVMDSETRFRSQDIDAEPQRFADIKQCYKSAFVNPCRPECCYYP